MTAGVPSARAPIPGGHDDRHEDVLREMREVAERVAITASLGSVHPRGAPQTESAPVLSGAAVAGDAGPGARSSGLGPPSAPRSGRAVLVGLLLFAALFAALWAGQGSQDGFRRGVVSSDTAAAPSGAAGQGTEGLDMGALGVPAPMAEPAATEGPLPVGSDARLVAKGESLLVALLDEGDVVAASVDGAQVAATTTPRAAPTVAPTADAPTPPAAQPVIALPVPPADADATALVDEATQALVALGVQDVSVEFDSGVLLVRGTLSGSGSNLGSTSELDGIAAAFTAVDGVEGVVARLVMSSEAAALLHADGGGDDVGPGEAVGPAAMRSERGALDETGGDLPERLAGVARLTDDASAAQIDAALDMAEARVIMQEYAAAASEGRLRPAPTDHRPSDALP